MTDLRQAAQAVVDRWDSPKWEWGQQGPTADLMAALRAALEQQAEPVQEPVAWVLSHSRGIEFSSRYPMQKSKEAADELERQHMGSVTVTPLYTTPPQQQAEPDRRALQAAGTHPAPCARHCEAKAFEIEIRSLKSRLKQQAEPVQEPVARVTSSGPHDFPLLEWLSADHSFRCSIGDLLYTAPPQQQAEPDRSQTEEQKQ